MQIDPAIASAAGVIGGAFGKEIVKDTYSAGKKWIAGYFGKQHPRAAEIADERATDCLDRFALRVEQLERNDEVTRETLNRALEDPSFGTMLHAALIGAAETAETGKHEILARLLSERLSVGGEDTKALALSLACPTVSRLNTSHIAILAVCAAARYGAPKFSVEAAASQEVFLQECDSRLSAILTAFSEVPFEAEDFAHLEGAACGNFVHMSWDLRIGLHQWDAGEFGLTWQQVFQLPFFRSNASRWSSSVGIFHTSTTGNIIGLAALEGVEAPIGLKSWFPMRPPSKIKRNPAVQLDSGG